MNVTIDGLYRVSTRYLCAGFIVRDGRIVACAPILRRKLAYWRTVAERVAAKEVWMPTPPPVQGKSERPEREKRAA